MTQGKLSSGKHPIAVVGVGKIARDQHLPAIAGSAHFDLAAVVSKSGADVGVPSFASVAEMAKAMPEIEAVSICTPPEHRLDIVAQALAADLHVMLEKPTAANVAQAQELARMTSASEASCFASWHSREAAHVAQLAQWLRGRPIETVEVAWKEDIRVWHPGQDWLLSSGFGVFDPAINALSILTHILPAPFFFEAGELRFPANRSAPIAADLTYRMGQPGGVIKVALDFEYDADAPCWDIAIRCADGATALLGEGGHSLTLSGETCCAPEGYEGEYPALYQIFGDLIDAGQQDFDILPMIHVFDALALGRRVEVAPFHW